MRRRLGAATFIVISHRLSTVSTFGRVLVFSGGRIVADGSPDKFVTTRQSAYLKLFAGACDPMKPSASLL
jgi:ABC-type multidrug transport system fused ATPase/permease subunit